MNFTLILGFQDFRSGSRKTNSDDKYTKFKLLKFRFGRKNFPFKDVLITNPYQPDTDPKH